MSKEFRWTDSASQLGSMLSLNIPATGAVTCFASDGWPRGAFAYRSHWPANFRVYLVTRDWNEARASNGATYGPPIRAVAGNEFDVEVADHAFSMAAACPPYVSPDSVKVGRFGALSPYFWVVSDLYRRVVPTGLGLMVVPEDTFYTDDGALVRSILSRFEVLHVGHLPMGRNFPTRPVGFVVRARDRKGSARAADVKVLSALLASGTLPKFENETLDLPVAPSLDVEPFFSKRVDPQEAMALASASVLFDEVVTEAGKPHGNLTPPIPLRLGHVALQLATGRLDGVVGDGRHRHVVKGRVIRKTTSETEETGDGQVLVKHDVLGVEITALGADGDVFAFASGGEEEGSTP